MKYRFDVKEINYGTIEVEANSLEEAQNKAEAGYTMGNTVWSSGEYEISDPRQVRDRKMDRDSR